MFKIVINNSIEDLFAKATTLEKSSASTNNNTPSTKRMAHQAPINGSGNNRSVPGILGIIVAVIGIGVGYLAIQKGFVLNNYY